MVNCQYQEWTWFSLFYRSHQSDTDEALNDARNDSRLSSDGPVTALSSFCHGVCREHASKRVPYGRLLRSRRIIATACGVIIHMLRSDGKEPLD